MADSPAAETLPPAPSPPSMTAATIPPLVAGPDSIPFTLPLPVDCAIPPRLPAGVETALVPGYEILGELGRGGMGVVYKARQIGLNRVVALKMILCGGHASTDELDRFRREAEAEAKLQHPNIVQIHEIGHVGGLPYFSLEYCTGGSLAAQLKGTPLPPKLAAEVVEQLALAMAYAHQQGIVHRDLKPANILLANLAETTSRASSSNRIPKGEKGTTLASLVPKVTDFGLAKTLDAAGATQSGAIMGTPSYMAPEQAAGNAKRVGPAADVYALGAILYECLTGRPPFKAATSLDTILQVIEHEPVPPSRLNRQVPHDLATVCLKCLEKDPFKRYATADDLADDLQSFRAGRPVRAKPAGLLDQAIKAAIRQPRSAVAVFAAVVLGSLLIYPLAALNERVIGGYAAALDALLKGVGMFPLMGSAALAANIVIFVLRQKRPWRESAWAVAILLTALVPAVCLLAVAISLTIRTYVAVL